MIPYNLQNVLENNPYPGRGIVLGLGADGMHATIAYFIMGRSQNSRNRVFVQRGGDVFTVAADEAKVEDPSLILYCAVHRLGEQTIVGNGVQTETVAAALAGGGTFEGALRTCTFEPDAPVFTPRITGLLHLGYGGFWYQMSLIKSEGAGHSVRRFFYDYPQPAPGTGHFLHTYALPDGDLPSFAGEPMPVGIQGDIDAFGQGLWQALDADNKVSLLVQSITLGGDVETRIYNKYRKE